MCKKRKKAETKPDSKTKISKADEEDSESSQCETESESESSSEESLTDYYSDGDDERCGGVKEVQRIPMRKNKRNLNRKRQRDQTERWQDD